MKGRGAHTVGPTDFQAVTPDAKTKDQFVIVDAIGATNHDFVDATPLQRDGRCRWRGCCTFPREVRRRDDGCDLVSQGRSGHNRLMRGGRRTR